MKNVMDFDGGYQAVIAYDPEIEMFRGEFVGLNGGADFYAKDTESLKREGKASLDVFLRMCAEDGVPVRKPQGKFALRLPPEVYHRAMVAAAAEGTSLNSFISDAVRQALAE
ncbi:MULTISPECIES: type II toxin-antitoxin system HicB family antitoxin [unclassified Desulfovibrio]|uniref:type II toxin-antitoxin system HicB family antitoxin n=1 Tax=unclassified Desulfovibrio TaxID=2593640 RepID=UPI000F5D669E|nr:MULTISPECIES: type II toxin-antitoxin system HicB family antitoxin [unclassified Desulfovibrio]RRD71232.1 type II toxin-antitoxin system HicB family antitoxin [Desulfovibrio sp. OH1209_COT-279]RRD87520.1 type II toxin-antitoxin system HicB family antitoxin [Desulfovibrio sp. OH1186_COT-070]